MKKIISILLVSIILICSCIVGFFASAENEPENIYSKVSIELLRTTVIDGEEMGISVLEKFDNKEEFEEAWDEFKGYYDANDLFDIMVGIYETADWDETLSFLNETLDFADYDGNPFELYQPEYTHSDRFGDIYSGDVTGVVIKRSTTSADIEKLLENESISFVTIYLHRDFYNPVIPACSCICHSDDIIQTILWRFLRFFYKIFGINKTCECGKAHY